MKRLIRLFTPGPTRGGLHGGRLRGRFRDQLGVTSGAGSGGRHPTTSGAAFPAHGGRRDGHRDSGCRGAPICALAHPRLHVADGHRRDRSQRARQCCPQLGARRGAEPAIVGGCRCFRGARAEPGGEPAPVRSGAQTWSSNRRHRGAHRGAGFGSRSSGHFTGHSCGHSSARQGPAGGAKWSRSKAHIERHNPTHFR